MKVSVDPALCIGVASEPLGVAPRSARSGITTDVRHAGPVTGAQGVMRTDTCPEGPAESADHPPYGRRRGPGRHRRHPRGAAGR
jgi:hypothetical protein